MGGWQIEETLDALQHRGVVIIDPRQTWVGPQVDIGRVCEGVVLHPGTRLCGARTFVGPGAQIGAQGPATLVDAVFGERARIDSGYVEGAVLLRDAHAGFGAHLRPGTLLEEHASTAHCVGLKHTILLSFVTLGSLINFCDVLMAGGTSRRDHSEVGSGFIHFNFTPWGERGDKATPSLVGDVQQGVFLRQPRIFLGGSGGLVGPGSVGYGSVTGAGQVVRRPVAAQRLVIEKLPALDRPFSPDKLDRVQPRQRRNVAYIAQLVALRAWYREVRRPRILAEPAFEHQRIVIDAAIELLDTCIAERVKRLTAFVAERGEPMPELELEPTIAACPLPVQPDSEDHVSWVQALPEADVEAGVAWLASIAAAVTGS